MSEDRAGTAYSKVRVTFGRRADQWSAGSQGSGEAQHIHHAPLYRFS